jgi:hypothetical protein
MARVTGYSLEVSYRLTVRSKRHARRVLPQEVDVVEAMTMIAGREPDELTYDSKFRRRKLTWYYRSSLSARAPERQIKRLRPRHRKLDIQTKVRYLSADVQEESLVEGKKKYLITPGQYKALMREGAARTCLECHQCIPKYSGRYPKNCPGCGGNVGNPIEDAIESIAVGKPTSTVIDTLLDKRKSGNRTIELNTSNQSS